MRVRGQVPRKWPVNSRTTRGPRRGSGGQLRPSAIEDLPAAAAATNGSSTNTGGSFALPPPRLPPAISPRLESSAARRRLTGTSIGGRAAATWPSSTAAIEGTSEPEPEPACTPDARMSEMRSMRIASFSNMLQDASGSPASCNQGGGNSARRLRPRFCPAVRPTRVPRRASVTKGFFLEPYVLCIG